jgi:hypothetical protein
MKFSDSCISSLFVKYSRFLIFGVVCFFFNTIFASSFFMAPTGAVVNRPGSWAKVLWPTIVATGSTLTFASGASSLGDSIMVRSIATNLYHVTCFASAAGGITIA